jgi:hypothetical protein
MSMPGEYPLSIYHGDSYHWQFKFWTDDAKTVAMDLTDVVAKAEIRNKAGGDQIFNIDCEVVLPNFVEATLSPLVSTSLPIGSMVWDLQLTWPTGAVSTLLAGPVTVVQDVTDSSTPLLRAANQTTAPMTVELRNRVRRTP